MYTNAITRKLNYRKSLKCPYSRLILRAPFGAIISTIRRPLHKSNTPHLTDIEFQKKESTPRLSGIMRELLGNPSRASAERGGIHFQSSAEVKDRRNRRIPIWPAGWPLPKILNFRGYCARPGGCLEENLSGAPPHSRPRDARPGGCDRSRPRLDLGDTRGSCARVPLSGARGPARPSSGSNHGSPSTSGDVVIAH